MKTCLKLAVLIAVCFILSSCATSHVATKIGQNIGESFSKATAIGVPVAQNIKKDWPYISGQLKGITAGDYERIVPYEVQETIDELDQLSLKEGELTMEYSGKYMGLVVRLEYLGAKFFWEKYGISLYKWFKVFITGG